MQNIIPSTNFSELYTDSNWSFHHVKRSQTNYVSHGYHRYPAKFIPQIVRKLINNYTDSKSIVFDPFGGCGTTLVEAKILGRESIGYDINPVAKLITKTKIRAIEPNQLKRSWEKFLKNYDDGNLIKINHSEKIEHWFEPNAINELDSIFQEIMNISNYKAKDFYLCAFSNILKNASRWLMRSTKPQIDPNKNVGKIFPVFDKQVRHMMKKNKTFYSLLKENGNLNIPARMHLRDSTKQFDLTDNSINLIVTSPPYVTSYEYADLHQLTTFWLADYKTEFPRWKKYAEEFFAHRKKYIGTRLGENTREDKLMSDTARMVVNNLVENKSKHTKSVEKYFADMNKSIKQMHRVLLPESKLCMIIGNTSLSDVEIKNAEAAAEQMSNNGFKIDNVIKRELGSKMITPYRDKNTGKFTSKNNPNSKRVYKYEYILIASKK